MISNMDNYRSTQIQDYGILRKKDGKDEELFVFGYSCKVYEDYDKSLYIDQGKHLIPWLGDETLKIDRYDCRGALSDLNPFLPKSDSFDRRACLSNEEKRIEALCDEERFRALTVNEEEEILYQEEELKRLQKALSNEKSYAEVGFNYDQDSNPTSECNDKENEDEDDEPFIPPYQLDLPVGMKIPKSRKHHEIIERTAFFINDQGTQMEILLKMKQAENPQFNFLSFDNDLHPYYRHMLTAIKNQRYKQLGAAPIKKPDSPQESSSEDTYLHPSLLKHSPSISLPESAPKIPNINYKPSVNCAYSALVNRIKETQSAGRDLPLLDGIERKDRTRLENPTYNPSLIDENSISLDANHENSKTDSLPLSALSKSARRRRIRKEKSKAAAASFKLYYADEQVADQNEDSQHYNSASDEAVSSDATSSESLACLKPVPAPAPVVQLPPADMQLIIDKMASYVAKNGRDFEEIVKAKGDPRFQFLSKDHAYNPYYNQKVQLYLQLENMEIVPPAPVDQNSKTATAKLLSDKGLKKPIPKLVKSSKSSKAIPICFSIKKPKDQETLEIKSAFPYEESEREDDEENDKDAELCTERSEESVEKSPVLADPEPLSTPPPAVETTILKKPADMSLEKWAQERLKGKLVTAAKEKLAAKERLAARHKDKQLQAERRKRAADFINLLQKDNLVTKASQPEAEHQQQPCQNQQPQPAEDTNSKPIDDEDKKNEFEDVISIPSGSTSSDSDSVVSVPISSDDEARMKKLKRKLPEEDLISSRKKHRDYSRERKHYEKPKRRSHSTSVARSPSRSRHTSRKYDRERRKSSHHKKKKQHEYYRSSSSSHHKKAHKNSHKSKRSRHVNESEKSDSGSSYDSGCESSKRVI